MLSRERLSNGKFVINAGKFYYDTKIKELIYHIRFPVKEIVVNKDTSIYRFQNNKLIQYISSLTTPMSSIFHMALTNQLKNFGLKVPFYNIEKIEKEGAYVFLTYTPNKSLSNFGQIKLSQRNNRLDGVVFFDNKRNIIARQFFKNYTTLGSIDFPQEVTIESKKNGKLYYQITTYKNINTNDFKDQNNYHYTFPK